MNQDSEQNDRRSEPRPNKSRHESRDGDTPRREGRSSERRDDVRNQNTDRPRFSRDTDRNAGPRSSSNKDANSDRARFQRDDRPGRSERSDNRNDERRGPTFRSADSSRSSRDTDRRSDSRRQDRNSDPSRSARFERGSGNSDTTRNSRSRDDRPRFDRDQRDDRTDRPRNARPDTDGPRWNRREDDSRSSNREGRSANTPRFDREDRRERPDSRRREEGGSGFANDRKNDRFGQNRPGRDANRSDERPRISRDDRPRDSNRNDFPRTDRNTNESRTSSSRFPRDRNRDERSDKPSFRREDSSKRDTNDRNQNQPTDDRRRTDNRGNNFDRESQFTSKQRKDSGDRRTGDFAKAPNYNLEQTRYTDTARQDRREKPYQDRSGEADKRQTATQRPSEPNTTRLNRYIANSGVCSRREADELIARGDISVNGKVVTEMGFKVKDGDTVKYGTKVLNPERFVYVLLNKPKDYITTTEDPEERRTVMELVADAGNFRMYPVGRLDRNTTGLLLLTNDGELADKLTHPSNNIRKIYQVELDKPITEEHFEALKKGTDLEDGPIKPDAISIVTPDAQVVGIEIHSGRNRIVRRMFEQFGYEVTKLDRTTYAGLTKKELPRGKWRFLDPKEVVKLKYLN